MSSHKFKIGETVILKPAISRNIPGGACEVIKQLPHNGHEFEYRIKSVGVCAPSLAADEMVMAAHLPTSIGSAKSRLRDRIISTYQQAQRIIMATSASPPAKMHSTMPAYAKACDHMRSDILQASKLFPDTDALLTWLLDDLADDVMSEQDRISLALIVRTITEETDERQRASRSSPADTVQSTESQI